MDFRQIIQKNKSKFDDAVEFYKSDIAGIRTGRATPAIVEDLTVEVYGSKMRLQEVATITAPEPRSLIIQPWDRQNLSVIESTIRKSSLGLNPVVDGQQVRLNFPSLTEERRKELTKLLKQKTEESRVKIRRIREDIWNEIQEMEKEGQLREDDKFKAREEIQKIVDDYNKKIEDMENKKENELMTS